MGNRRYSMGNWQWAKDKFQSIVMLEASVGKLTQSPFLTNYIELGDESWELRDER